ncbi:MAG: response regulator [Desulfovibrio sp.]|jgi:signal transduction histidine kinase/DNA-binding NarL/FixJ family response regulator/HPt (histidine-containing phosphotransfer) domain-containing protein|nr:response regulator [Desulfovibrio sp.]
MTQHQTQTEPPARPAPPAGETPGTTTARAAGSLRSRLRRRRPALRWNIQTFIVPAVLVALWGVLLLALYQWNARTEAAHVRELALLQARAFFSQIVSTRAWNAAHGGVFVRTSELGRPNPWLPPDQRTLLASDGTLLTRMNPAYMTRQISEFLTTSQGVSFRITGLHPLRQENEADPWENESLLAFSKGARETFTLALPPAHEHPHAAESAASNGDTRHGPSFRYMAPLMADQSCLGCHRTADDTVGGLRGGISVSIAAAPLLALERQRLDQTALAYAIIGVVGLLGIGGASLQVSRKKALAEAANRMKSAFLANMSHDMRTPLTGIIGMAELLSGFQPGQPGETGGTENTGATSGVASAAPANAPIYDDAQQAAYGARYHEYLGQLRCAAANLLEIVNDITDFSCLESGRMRLAPRTFRLRPALEACLGVFRFAGERKGLSLSLHVAENVPEALVGDDFRLRQALGNLIGNAVKFTRQGGIAVVVNLVPEPAPHTVPAAAAAAAPRSGSGTVPCAVLLRFAVVDTGVGIPAEQQETIFESFVQGEAASLLCLGGTGLGLAISREIARMLDGDIGVSSTPGAGSEFWFTARFTVAGPPPDGGADSDAGRALHGDAASARNIWNIRNIQSMGLAAWVGTAGNHTACPAPSMMPTTARPPETIPASGTVSPLRLLVADDNPVNRLFMQDVLRGAGHQVAVAADGVEALRLLEELRPDLALLDVRMPGCDGTEVVRRLRAGQVPGVAPDMPVLAVTASAVGRESAALLGAGMTGCVCKPLTTAMLLTAVADAATGGTPLECPGTNGYANGMHHWREGDGPTPSHAGTPPTEAITAESAATESAGPATPGLSATFAAPEAPAGPDSSDPSDTPGTPDSLGGPDAMDEAAALEALGGNRPLFVKLCRAFLDEVDTRRAALTAAVREGRRQDALREAHALRNSAGMLRLSALHGLCDDLEQAAGLPAAAPGGQLPDLLNLLDRLLPLLEAGVARVRAVTTAAGATGAAAATGATGTTSPTGTTGTTSPTGTTDTATPGTSPAKETGR